MGLHTKLGKLETPWGEEYTGFKIEFGSKQIVKAKFVAEGEIIKAVFKIRS